MNNDVIDAKVFVHNLPTQKIVNGAFVVVRVVDTEFWYYGTWSNKETAQDVAVEIGNGVVLQIGESV